MNHGRKDKIFGCRTRGVPRHYFREVGGSQKGLRSGVTNSDGKDVADTSPTFKVLEEGAATLSKEEAGRLAQRQMKFIQNLQAALIRIENITYGICRETGKLIPKERLRAVPHATLSIEAKQGGAK